MRAPHVWAADARLGGSEPSAAQSSPTLQKLKMETKRKVISLEVKCTFTQNVLGQLNCPPQSPIITNPPETVNGNQL